jgi:hypothetical protein
MFIKSKVAITAAIFAIAGIASADLARVGPLNLENGFPQWYQDNNGLALELCLPNDAEIVAGSCILAAVDIPDATAPISFPNNYPGEAFYAAASSVMTVGGGGDAALEMALESTFAGGEPLNGDQIVFARIRIRIDIPSPGGTYTVTHPYGVEVFPDLAPGGRAINFTEDFGLGINDFTSVLKTRVSPFLLPAVTPGGAALAPVALFGNTYIADPTLETAVTGSPFGTNTFKIEGPNIGGVGIHVIESSEFLVMGRLFQGEIGADIDAYSTHYERDDLTAGFEIHTKAIAAIGAATPVFGVSGSNILSHLMHGDGAGHYHLQVKPDTPELLPASVILTNYADSVPASMEVNLTDKVQVTAASWNPLTQELTISANSSDKISGAAAPVLRAFGDNNLLGELDAMGNFVATGIAVPYANVEVKSSAGGSGSLSVSNGYMNPVRPVVANDSAATQQDAPVVIAVTANDSADIAVGSVEVIGQPQGGSLTQDLSDNITYTRSAGFYGTDTFYYVGKDAAGNSSNIATVSVVVTPDLNAPVANDDAATVAINGSININVLANDTDPEGNIINSTVTVVNQPADGFAVANADGTITFAAGFNESVQTFDYTVSDSTGLVSNLATVTVTVADITTNNVPIAGNDAFTVTGNTTTALNVLANDLDTDGNLDLTSVAIVTQPANGSVVANADGSISFTSAGIASLESFTYTVNDLDGATSNVATVSVDVQAAEVLTVARAQIRGQSNWRVDGLSSINSGTVTIHIGVDLTGPILGTATILTDGTWDYRASNTLPLDATETVSVVSSNGAQVLAIPVIN